MRTCCGTGRPSLECAGLSQSSDFPADQLMLRGLRKASSNWLGKVVMAAVVGFLVISFAIWGIGDIFRGFGRSTVAKIGRTEVTIEQFRQFRADYVGNPIYAPYVAGVSWNDANAFCDWLSRKEGKPYRLPTISASQALQTPSPRR